MADKENNLEMVAKDYKISPKEILKESEEIAKKARIRWYASYPNNAW